MSRLQDQSFETMRIEVCKYCTYWQERMPPKRWRIISICSEFLLVLRTYFLSSIKRTCPRKSSKQNPAVRIGTSYRLPSFSRNYLSFSYETLMRYARKTVSIAARSKQVITTHMLNIMAIGSTFMESSSTSSTFSIDEDFVPCFCSIRWHGGCQGEVTGFTVLGRRKLRYGREKIRRLLGTFLLAVFWKRIGCIFLFGFFLPRRSQGLSFRIESDRCTAGNCQADSNSSAGFILFDFLRLGRFIILFIAFFSFF